MTLDIDVSSTWRGIQHIKRPYVAPTPQWSARFAWGWWAHLWTPIWHEGRGPYVSIGLGLLAIYRGY